MSKDLTETYFFEKSTDLLNFICGWNNNLQGYVFRGHSKESYQLLPSVLRSPSFVNNVLKDHLINPINWDSEYLQIQAEYKVLREFYKVCDMNGLNAPGSSVFKDSVFVEHDLFFIIKNRLKGEYLEWIDEDMMGLASLAQHHGIPTRLLDWTYDPFISAYFASSVSGIDDIDENIMIWCMNIEYISFLTNVSSEIGFNIIHTPYFSNPNILAQKGLFTHIKSSCKIDHENHVPVNRKPVDLKILDFISQFKYNSPNIFKKLLLPKSEAINLQKNLLNHGYGQAKIYPGYNGVAKQVLSKYC